jgi:hypothetical protein
MSKVTPGRAGDDRAGKRPAHPVRNPDSPEGKGGMGGL